MCKPGSACCGNGVTSGGAGMALAVLGTVAAVSMASVVVSAILTALLVTVFSVAAGGLVVLVAVLRRTRGVVTWPMGMSRVPAAGPPRAPVPVRALPAPRPPAPGRLGPAAGVITRPAIAAHQPLAIEPQAPAHVRLLVPGGSRDPAVVWLPARSPGSVTGAAPAADVPSEARPDWTDLVAAAFTPDRAGPSG